MDIHTYHSIGPSITAFHPKSGEVELELSLFFQNAKATESAKLSWAAGGAYLLHSPGKGCSLPFQAVSGPPR